MAKLNLNVKWFSSHGETPAHMLAVKPLTMTYFQVHMDNGNIVEIDIVNNVKTLRMLLECIAKSALQQRVQSNGKLNDQVLVMWLEHNNMAKEVIRQDINLYPYNITIVDFNNESENYRALISRIVKFMELACTIFVKPEL